MKYRIPKPIIEATVFFLKLKCHFLSPIHTSSNHSSISFHALLGKGKKNLTMIKPFRRCGVLSVNGKFAAMTSRKTISKNS